MVCVLKMNGGVVKEDFGVENVDVVCKGCVNFGWYIENIKQFGVFVVVVINYFMVDIDVEVQVVKEYCVDLGVDVILVVYWVKGLEGMVELVEWVVVFVESGVV